MKLIEKIIIHDTLNKKLFSDDDKLYPEVKDRILDIVTEFLDYSELDLNIADIQLVGSNVSYNYTEDSDLDVHIITNFDLIDAPKELLQALYNAKKSQFNDKFDIKIRGIDVEMYVQDINAGIHSNGIYSVLDDDWIKFPDKITGVTQYVFPDEMQDWTNHVNKVISEKNYEKVIDAINKIYMIRSKGLATDGEFGKGNQLFKEIRSAGLLDKLKDALIDIMSNRLSLEELSRSQILSRDF